MRIRSVVVAAAALVMVVAPAGVALAAPPPVATSQAPVYYLALGDSLAQGVQPNPAGKNIETHQGYVNDIYAHYKAQIPNLWLVNLGCPGETVESMIGEAPPVCPAGWYRSYGHASNQLTAAVNFLNAHPGQVALVTIDIGANDVDGCFSATGIDQTCLGKGMDAVQNLLPGLVKTLQKTLQAADPNGLIVGMNYYDPFLAAYLTGQQGQVLAETFSVPLAKGFNDVLAAAYGSVPVADVADAFSTYDMLNTDSLPGIGQVPLNVAQICKWTWMCAPSPVGPNIHANAAGYAMIAGAFESVIDSGLPTSTVP